MKTVETPAPAMPPLATVLPRRAALRLQEAAETKSPRVLGYAIKWVKQAYPEFFREERTMQ